MKIEFYLHLFIVLPDKGLGPALDPGDIGGLIQHMDVEVGRNSDHRGFVIMLGSPQVFYKKF